MAHVQIRKGYEISQGATMNADEFDRKYVAKAEVKAEVEAEPKGDGEDILMLRDIRDSLSLLGRVTRLLGYIGDVELCRALSKRERETITRVNTDITAYLDDVTAHYEEEE